MYSYQYTEMMFYVMDLLQSFDGFPDWHTPVALAHQCMQYIVFSYML